MGNGYRVKIDSIYYFLLATIFILIAGLRGNTRDTIIYKFVYENVNEFSLNFSQFYESTGMEVGYGFLAFIFNNLGVSFTLFLTFISLLSFYFIKKASDVFDVNSFLVLLCYIPVFFANHQLMQIRQGLVIVIGYYFIALILKNKSKILAYGLFILGLLFHNILFVFIIFISNWFNRFIATDKIKLIIKVVVVVVMVFLFCRLITDFGIIQITDRISNYNDSEYSETRSFFHPANLRSFLLLLLFVFLKPVDNKNYVYNFLVVLYAIGLGFRLGFYDFVILSGRLSTLFTFSEIFLIPMLLDNKFNKVAIIIFVLIYFCINLYINLVYQVPFILIDYFKPL
ncbi:EpsG family protein [Acinetobacter johnsonii]|uniref:EpsG family protein n=1 Tax=Acinetobacter johnsonii TaxID=40214 RepID=UPI00244A4881|nr:EpsG family protein [Acinetobacter johnsonii]MDH0711167.1 EpsG family protein [Acinetobacter johnsonii]